MAKRTVIIDMSFSCCKDEKYRGIDHTIRITLHQEAEKFAIDALVVWKDTFLDSQKVIDYIYMLGDNKCSVVDPSLKMCRKSPNEPRIDVVNYFEEAEIPPYIMDRIDTIRDYIAGAETYDEKKAFQDEAVNLLRPYMSEDEARTFVPIGTKKEE